MSERQSSGDAVSQLLPDEERTQAEAAVAVAFAAQQRMREERTGHLIGAMVALVSGYANGDHAMAVSALSTVVGQVLSVLPNPSAGLAQVVRIAHDTSSAIVAHQRAAAGIEGANETAAAAAGAA